MQAANFPSTNLNLAGDGALGVAVVGGWSWHLLCNLNFPFQFPKLTEVITVIPHPQTRNEPCKRISTCDTYRINHTVKERPHSSSDCASGLSPLKLACSVLSGPRICQQKDQEFDDSGAHVRKRISLTLKHTGLSLIVRIQEPELVWRTPLVHRCHLTSSYIIESTGNLPFCSTNPCPSATTGSTL